jgi:hypothetical protein
MLNKIDTIFFSYFRIPSYFGTIEPVAAAKKVIEAMRRDYVEASIPGYLLYVGKVVR